VTSLLELEDVKKYFAVRSTFFRKGGIIKAVDGVSYTVNAGQTFGLAGETGCGKTTLAKCILRVLEPTSGTIRLDGDDVFDLRGEALKNARRRIQAIFQNPLMSLDPRMTVQSIVAEPLKTHRVIPDNEIQGRILELLRTVGLSEEHFLKYPHELSGGQNQRVAIARALALNPNLIVLDEPTSSLDVSVQAQILNLLTDIQEKAGLAYLFISHDLSVLRYLTDSLAVMYLGRIVEIGPSDDIFANPAHPYTQLLLSSVPDFTITDSGFSGTLAEMPERFEAPPENGCRFYPRCQYKMDKCKVNDPPLYKISEKHNAACFMHEDGPANFYSKPNPRGRGFS
jgi:oligopeptide/dipeptide ABC transporter ATP-binding protein